eukprot:213821-Chlamydomonas_euryale.AAC.1
MQPRRQGAVGSHPRAAGGAAEVGKSERSHARVRCCMLLSLMRRASISHEALVEGFGVGALQSGPQQPDTLLPELAFRFLGVFGFRGTSRARTKSTRDKLPRDFVNWGKGRGVGRGYRFQRCMQGCTQRCVQRGMCHVAESVYTGAPKGSVWLKGCVPRGGKGYGPRGGKCVSK